MTSNEVSPAPVTMVIGRGTGYPLDSDRQGWNIKKNRPKKGGFPSVRPRGLLLGYLENHIALEYVFSRLNLDRAGRRPGWHISFDF